MTSDEILTVGHSNHTAEGFVHLLKRHGVDAVCDVRSTPYSRMQPQFNREDIKRGPGARTDDPSCYTNGKVRYDRLVLTGLFRSGISRLRDGMKQYRIAPLCAEKDPLECHRTILVAKAMQDGVLVRHILHDEAIEAQDRLEERLMESLGMDRPDMIPHPRRDHRGCLPGARQP